MEEEVSSVSFSGMCAGRCLLACRDLVSLPAWLPRLKVPSSSSGWTVNRCQ